MTQPIQNQLSRRERQIMDALYRLGEAGTAEVVEHLPDRPAYNSVRVTLGILERKGVVRHRREGSRYIYRPTVPAEGNWVRFSDDYYEVAFRAWARELES